MRQSARNSCNPGREVGHEIEEVITDLPKIQGEMIIEAIDVRMRLTLEYTHLINLR